ncbi:MAG: tRNA pseudouridine(55) synthase TruB [Ornithinimicrobium sp.]|uniref:tRNA pseudouridine(55) synthase TruB n=1 Tax=Ornithinimicrobium sp. TaxID=1977084 RepID=UPI003D9B633D
MSRARPAAPGAPIGDGLLVVDKPSGWTSHDVVARARGICGTRRVGHAGTLDPMATGVLVLGVNRGTKLLTFFVGCDKTYSATIRLGETTVTDDAEGEVTAAVDASAVADRSVAEAVRALTGPIRQVPSAVSAIKVDGVRSYARVRSGKAVDLAARPVTVHRFDVLGRRTAPGARHTDLDVQVAVSSGTYVRALARDLGVALGVGGHLTALRRTTVGHLTAECAVPLDDLELDAGAHLVSLADAVTAVLPVRQLDDAETDAVRHGRRIPSAEPGRSGPVAAMSPDGHVVAVLEESSDQARSLVVLRPGAPG